MQESTGNCGPHNIQMSIHDKGVKLHLQLARLAIGHTYMERHSHNQKMVECERGRAGILKEGGTLIANALCWEME